MELGEYLAVLRKRWLSIALIAVLGGVGGYAFTARDTPQYRSTATVYLTTTRGDTISELNQGASYTSNLMATYALLATTPVVLEPVIDELDLNATPRSLAGTLQIDIPLNSYFIDIKASNPSPSRAAAIANAVAANLSAAVADLSPTATDGSAALKMTQVTPATPASVPYSPRPKLTAAAGFALGLGLAVGLALVLGQLDTRVRSPRDLPHNPARTALGVIPRDRAMAKDARHLVVHPHSTVAEAYRRLRTNLQFLDASRPLRAFTVTSSLPGEGKSTTSVNLALIMAERGARVLLVDADLRSPSVASLCGLEGGAGLSAVLIHEATLDDVVQPWQVEGLDILAAGQIPPNPSQLIESAAMIDLLREAQQRYDLVIVDSAPLLAVTDAAILARRTDGALVVARSRKIRRPDLAEALASLDSVGAQVLGVLVNGTHETRSELRYGYGQTPTHRIDRPFKHVRPRRAGAESQPSTTTSGSQPRASSWTELPTHPEWSPLASSTEPEIRTPDAGPDASREVADEGHSMGAPTTGEEVGPVNGIAQERSERRVVAPAETVAADDGAPLTAEAPEADGAGGVAEATSGGVPARDAAPAGRGRTGSRPADDTTDAPEDDEPEDEPPTDLTVPADGSEPAPTFTVPALVEDEDAELTPASSARPNDGRKA